MGWKSVKSTDPRKANIVAHFKSRYDCTRVTMVKILEVEGKPAEVSANLLKSYKHEGRTCYQTVGVITMTLCLLLALLVPLLAQANPDGYVGRLAASLEAAARPQQSWSTQQSRYLASLDSAYYDLGDSADSQIKESGYSVGLDLRYPVTESLTFGLGGCWNQVYKTTTTKFTQFTSAAPGGPYKNAWIGSTTLDDNHAVYELRARVTYYFGN